MSIKAIGANLVARNVKADLPDVFTICDAHNLRR
jgi:hypothetical protein